MDIIGTQAAFGRIHHIEVSLDLTKHTTVEFHFRIH
jgi:hypothetical protein